jgi:hypothetical protein
MQRGGPQGRRGLGLLGNSFMLREQTYAISIRPPARRGATCRRGAAGQGSIYSWLKPPGASSWTPVVVAAATG